VDRERSRRLEGGRLRLLYCDDQERFRKAFCELHDDKDFDVELISDLGAVYHSVKTRRRSDLPDLVLLDLYHDIASDPADHERERESAERALGKLRAHIQRVKPIVDNAWQPQALDVLEELRETFPARELPVLIYTQFGLLLLEDDQLRRIEASDADWLLKDGRISRATQAARIRRFVRQARAARRLQRDSKLAVGSAITSALLGAVLTILVSHL
jgi:hypothetical protein